MIIQPKDLSEERELATEVLIIGSGAGGSMAAYTLAAQGIKVIVLEEGPYVDKSDFNQKENELVRKMYRRGGALATDDMSIRILQGRVFGGSTTINWMNCFRTPDDVLEEWERDYGLNHYLPENMQSHFERIEKRMSVHPVPDEHHNPQNRIILDAAAIMGIDGNVCNNNSIGCIGCGKCGLGCSYDAKQDMRLTYLTDAQNDGTTIYTSMKAEKIVRRSEDEQIISAVVQDGSGRTFQFKTQRTIVAASAIMTPLLLQSSGLTKGGLVGKYLHIHPVAGTVGVYDREIHPTYGIPMSASSHELKNITENYGVWQEVPDLEVFLAGVNMPGTGPQRREYMKQSNNMGVILTLNRDGASKNSSGRVKWIRGFNRQSGHFGLRKYPSVRYRIDPLDKKHLLIGIRQAIEMHFAAGATMVLPMHAMM
ncbi:MAG: FAD-dependent oxidoreductase, partial [Candidatus Kariarchaeaceae archaeon]